MGPSQALKAYWGEHGYGQLIDYSLSIHFKHILNRRLGPKGRFRLSAPNELPLDPITTTHSTIHTSLLVVCSPKTLRFLQRWLPWSSSTRCAASRKCLWPAWTWATGTASWRKKWTALYEQMKIRGRFNFMHPKILGESRPVPVQALPTPQKECPGLSLDFQGISSLCVHYTLPLNHTHIHIVLGMTILNG